MMRDAVAPPQYGGLGAMPQPQKIFQKMNVEIAYFWHFCQLKWSLLQRRQSRIRQQALQLTWSNKTSSNLQTHPRWLHGARGCTACLCPTSPTTFTFLSGFAQISGSSRRTVGVGVGGGWGREGGSCPLCPPPPPAPAVATLMVIGRRNRDRLGLVIVILSVCPSVCLLHSWTVSTRFDLRSRFLHHIVAP